MRGEREKIMRETEWDREEKVTIREGEQDGSLWISGLIGSLLLLSQREATHSTASHSIRQDNTELSLSFPLLHHPIVSGERETHTVHYVSLSPVFTFQTNQSISAEKPEGRTTP